MPVQIVLRATGVEGPATVGSLVLMVPSARLGGMGPKVLKVPPRPASATGRKRSWHSAQPLVFAGEAASTTALAGGAPAGKNNVKGRVEEPMSTSAMY